MCKLGEASDYIEVERPSIEDIVVAFRAAKYVGVTHGMIRSYLRELGGKRRGRHPTAIALPAKRWTAIGKFIEANPDATVWRIMTAMGVSRAVAMEALRAIGINPRQRMPCGIFGAK